LEKIFDSLVYKEIQRYLDIETRRLPLCKRWVNAYRDSWKYKLLRDKSYRVAFKKAVFLCHTHLIDFFISRDLCCWNNGLAYAVKGRHRNLIDFLSPREPVIGTLPWGMHSEK